MAVTGRLHSLCGETVRVGERQFARRFPDISIKARTDEASIVDPCENW
jgi:hypothetical protein